MSVGKIMSIEDMKKAYEAYTEAVNTDEPVAIETPTGNVVNGSPSLVGSNNPKNYKVTLYLPILGEAPEGARIVMNGTSYEQIIEAKEVFITSRIARRVRNYASVVALAFTEFKEDGTSNVYTPQDLLKVFQLFDDNVIEACEKMVSVVLGIPENLIQYITDVSLITVCKEILANNPSFFQED